MSAKVIVFIGGTGPEGLGLAARFAAAGHEIVIGSRSPERAQQAVEKIRARVLEARATGMVNEEAVRRGDIVFVTIPFAGHRDTLEALAPAIGAKIVVDVVSPLAFEGGKITAIAVPEGSAAEQAQALLPQAQVVAGFHHLDASRLMRVERPVEGDVIVCGDHRVARETVMALAEEIVGVRALDGGPLANSRYLEEFTVVLLNLNKTYKVHSSLKIAGIPGRAKR
ncbi:MAG: NADPH-dependent F420 reductase [Dehalococcoidia bacterium]|nr:MAG: NADPH-dependent F420 reductase [Dehalococcoidia bacterium]